MSTLTLRLPQEIRDDLEAISQKQHKPLSDIVRDSLRRYIAIQELIELRQKSLPFAEKAGVVSDEDVFNIVS